MVPSGETDRLLLCPLALADADQIQAVFPRWEIVRYLQTRVPWPYPQDAARQFIEQIALPAMERGESWNWSLRLKFAPERIIGNLELRCNRESHRGFWLVPELQGRGLMTEACCWANDFWFETLRFPLLRVSKAAENLASRRISERMGMRLVGTAEKDYICGRLPSDIWEMMSEEWRAWKVRHSGGSPV